MLRYTIPGFRKPFPLPQPRQVNFFCAVCGKEQMGPPNAVVCPGRGGDCRNKWALELKHKREAKSKRRKNRVARKAGSSLLSRNIPTSNK
jgi:hypothetical protein